MRATICHLTVLLGSLARAQLQGNRPNFLVLVADDMGFNDVSWNNPDMKTPALDLLSKQGVRLDTFYSQPRCSPSRAALLTGLYPYKMGIQRGNISPFRPSGLATRFTLLPEMLEELGYTSHLVGLWHLGYCHTDYLPTNRGFSSFFGQLTERSDHYTRLLHTNQYVGSGYDLWTNTTVSYEGAGLYSSELWAQKAKEKLSELEGSESPWLLQVSFTLSSQSFQAPDRFMELYDSGDRNDYSQVSRSIFSHITHYVVRRSSRREWSARR